MYRKTSLSTAGRLNTGLLVITALILIGIVGLSYREWTQYSRPSADAKRTREVVDSVGRLLSGLIDAETGQRGFVLTGEARYLEPYNRAFQAIPTEEANLSKLLAQSQGQSELGRLSNLVDQKLAELRQVIDLRRTQGLTAALNVVITDRGKQIMDQIRGISADIQHREESIRIEAAVERDTAAQRALLITAIGSLILLAFFAVGNTTIKRAILGREEALTDAQNTRDSLKTTIASIGDAVISTDDEGRIVFANKVACSLLRAPEADIVGKHLDDVFRIVNEFSRAKVESPVTKVLREGAVVGLANHTVLIAQDGTEIPIDDSGAPIRSEGGPIRGTVLVFRDITERRGTEQTRQLLSAIVESSDDAIVSEDVNGVITSWNNGAKRVFGYSAEEIIGRPVSVLASADRQDEISGILERVNRGERIDNYQTVRRAKSGQPIHVSVTISPVHDALGRVIGASRIMRDITAQVRAQEQVVEERERLRVTLNSIGDAVMTTDAAGRIAYLNPVAERLTGWTSAEAAGQSLEEVFRIVNAESRHPVENPVTKVLREGGIVGLANHTVLIARDGKEISVDDSAAPIRDARGEMIGVVLIFRDITERRATEQLLAAQTYELRERTHLLEYAHCFVRSLEDRIVYWSPGATELYGFSEGDAVGQSSHTLLQTEFPAPLDEILSQLMREGHWDGDLVHKCRDGRRVTVASHWVVHRDVEGRVTSILEVNVDITERKQAEQMVQESEDRFRSLANAIPQLAWMANSDGWIFWYNDRWYEYTGTTPEQMEGWGWRSVHDPEVLPMVLERWKASIESGEPFDMVFPLRGRDGVLRPFLTRVMAVRGQDGRVARWFGTNTDITEHRQAEERFRLAVEAAPNGMVVADEGGKIVLVNSEMERLFGWSREDIIGQPVEFLVPQRLSDEHRRYREGFYADPRARMMGEGRDLRARRKDGSEFPVEIALNPIETSQGRLVLGAIVDITERKRIEEQRLELLSKERALASERTLRETEAELARVVRALAVGELAASIAHEVNQPLAGVITNAEAGLRWLGGEIPRVEDAKDSLALIVRDGNRASAVIRRIREFLKKETDDSTSIDINEAIQDAVFLAHAELLKHQIILRLELSLELPPVRVDRIQLQQVILNLIMNGGEAMVSTDGSKELRVISRKSAGPGGQPGVLVAVRDCGAGIEPRGMQRMFDPFFTTKPKGMGMGLSISRSIMEAHGGRIWAEANEGAGLTVQFTLPAESENQGSADASSPS